MTPASRSRVIGGGGPIQQEPIVIQRIILDGPPANGSLGSRAELTANGWGKRLDGDD